MLAGVLRVVSVAKRLSARIDELKVLPLAGIVQQTQWKIDSAQQAIGSVPDLIERARVALAELERARDRLRGLNTVGGAARLIGAFFSGS
jgi:hypothetical protein